MKQPINTKTMTRGALLVGPVVPPRSIVTGENLGVPSHDRERFLALSRVFRVRSHEDGWFVDGSGHKAQIWSIDAGRLGLTVVGRHLVRKCLSAGSWLTPHAVGDDEANFHCPWDDEHLGRLRALVKLQCRKPPTKKATP